MWGPASGLGTYKLYFADPQAGQVGFFGVIEENGHPQILALRLKVEDRRISEIETIVARRQPGIITEPEGLIDQPSLSGTLAPSERRSRAEMIAIANNPEGSPIHSMTAGEQFDTGFSRFITEIRERRFPVVDEERGLMYAIVFFDHAGTVPTVKLADGTTMTVPPPYDTPYTYMIGEL